MDDSVYQICTNCLHEELRRVPSHWASSSKYVCGGCEREPRIRLWALVCIRACVTVCTCTYGSLCSCFICACSVSVCFCEFTIALAYVYISTYSVCAHILLIYTCVYLLRTLSLCVCTPFTSCVGESAHM